MTRPTPIMERMVPRPIPTRWPVDSRPMEVVMATFVISKQFFGQPHAFPGKIRDGLDNAVSWVGDQTHVEGEGRADASEHNGKGQEDHLPRQGSPKGAQAVRRQVGEPDAEPVKKPGEHQTQRKL